MELDFNKYQQIFNKTKSVYKETSDLDIELKFKKDIFFTMRGAIQYSSLFNKKRKYFLFVNSSKKHLFSELDDSNIMAWFAHELAHIIEYKKMSNWKLFTFLIKYTFNLKFRFIVEKRVNAYAANNGFAREMFATWKKFLILKEVVNSKYKQYIIKNHRPNWEQIRDSALSIGVNQKEYELFK